MMDFLHFAVQAAPGVVLLMASITGMVWFYFGSDHRDRIKVLEKAVESLEKRLEGGE